MRQARMRIEELKMMYRRLAQKQEKDGTWDWWIEKQVREIESELQIEHGKTAS